MISIISPVFNAAKYMETCLQSVADQYFTGLEHLVIDGGSTDGTQDLIRNFALKYTHIKWISEKDKGQSDAMNKGIRLAQNHVISFLNADDRYEDGAFAFVRSIFEKAASNTFLVGNCRVIKEDGSVYMINKPYPFDPVGFILDYNFPYNPSAYFYHKSLHHQVGMYEEADHLTMDIDFLFRMLPVAKIQYEDRILGNYVMVSDSKTMKEISAGRNVENLLAVFKKYEEQLTIFQKLRLKFLRVLGKNRGWLMFYFKNPLNLFKVLKLKK